MAEAIPIVEHAQRAAVYHRGCGASCFGCSIRHAFHVAVAEGDVDTVRRVLQQDVNYMKSPDRTAGRGTAWHVAAGNGRVEVLKLLVERVYNGGAAELKRRLSTRLIGQPPPPEQVLADLLAYQNKRGLSPLMAAASADQDAAVEYLLQLGADPWQADHEGLNSAHHAARTGAVAALQMLLAHQVPVSARAPPTVTPNAKYIDSMDLVGMTPLHHATWCDQRQAMVMLINLDASLIPRTLTQHPGWKDLPPGATPLHMASMLGCMDRTKLLLRAYFESAADLLPSQTALMATVERRRRARSHPDPRLILTRTQRLSFHLAARAGHRALLDWLDPSVPLMFLFGGDDAAGVDQGNDVKVIGVPRLSVLSAKALHQALLDSLVAADKDIKRMAEERAAKKEARKRRREERAALKASAAEKNSVVQQLADERSRMEQQESRAPSVISTTFRRLMGSKSSVASQIGWTPRARLHHDATIAEEDDNSDEEAAHAAAPPPAQPHAEAEAAAGRREGKRNSHHATGQLTKENMSMLKRLYRRALGRHASPRASHNSSGGGVRSSQVASQRLARVGVNIPDSQDEAAAYFSPGRGPRLPHMPTSIILPSTTGSRRLLYQDPNSNASDSLLQSLRQDRLMGSIAGNSLLGSLPVRLYPPTSAELAEGDSGSVVSPTTARYLTQMMNPSAGAEGLQSGLDGMTSYASDAYTTTGAASTSAAAGLGDSLRTPRAHGQLPPVLAGRPSHDGHSMLQPLRLPGAVSTPQASMDGELEVPPLVQSTSPLPSPAAGAAPSIPVVHVAESRDASPCHADSHKPGMSISLQALPHNAMVPMPPMLALQARPPHPVAANLRSALSKPSRLRISSVTGVVASPTKHYASTSPLGGRASRSPSQLQMHSPQLAGQEADAVAEICGHRNLQSISASSLPHSPSQVQPTDAQASAANARAPLPSPVAAHSPAPSPAAAAAAPSLLRLPRATSGLDQELQEDDMRRIDSVISPLPSRLAQQAQRLLQAMRSSIRRSSNQITPSAAVAAAAAHSSPVQELHDTAGVTLPAAPAPVRTHVAGPSSTHRKHGVRLSRRSRGSPGGAWRRKGRHSRHSSRSSQASISSDTAAALLEEHASQLGDDPEPHMADTARQLLLERLGGAEAISSRDSSISACSTQQEEDPDDICPVCLDEMPNLLVQRCGHTMCMECAGDLVKRHTITPSLCPYCRSVIAGFKARPR